MSAQPYITPSSTTPLPGGLTLTQFIQTVIVGISGITGALVRPKWQVEPPKQPDIATDWISFGVDASKNDVNAYVDVNTQDITVFQRHQILDIEISFFGPAALDTYQKLNDGLQIPTNLQALTLANMGLIEMTDGRQMPDMLNGRFVGKILSNLFLRRQIQRVYPIPTLISAAGTIHTVTGNEEYLLNWQTPEIES